MSQMRDDLTGKRFERLIVTEFIGTLKRNQVWRCICDCGNERDALKHHLLVGKAKSCGCHKPNYDSKKNRLYKIWTQMKARCNNHNHSQYKNYGGRGIEVCERWQSFEKFRDDLSESHDTHAAIYGVRNTTLERIDNDKGYNPENCKWATKKEQRRNCRQSKYYSYNGQTITAGEIADKYHIHYGTIESRLRNGWTIERIINTPTAPQRGGRKKNVSVEASSKAD
jgi:hypothetical protein